MSPLPPASPGAAPSAPSAGRALGLEPRALERRAAFAAGGQSCRREVGPVRCGAALLLALVLAACARPPAQPAGEGAPPPVPVTVQALEAQPVEDASEYLATLTSRRAVVLFPQVSGYVRAIAAQPGKLVKAGALLLQVDGAAEAASLANLQAQRESLVSSSSFAFDRRARARALREDGIVSQQDLDQAQAQVQQAEAALRASDATIASQKARLAFFSITAPIDGVVGNVPVKVGDFVTPATVLTSVTQDSALEAELQVPVERAAALTAASQVRLLAQDGRALAQGPVTFVSPRTDPGTQLVLVKAQFEAIPGLRADQIVRGRVIFGAALGLLLPTRAVTRQAGQTFAFVVDAQAIAHRIPVTLGALQGNAYAVTAGLEAGQKVVVSGLQMVADGASVAASVEP